ncbi:MAG: hypothetical protein LBB23_03330 [Rickettsiales bacterium]|jgi:hypothetical protein|nr:hypothetical protein [Rickettsiales bacterium]
MIKKTPTILMRFNRWRDIDECLTDTHFFDPKYPSIGKDILVVGGGDSTYSTFGYFDFNWTNIDLNIPDGYFQIPWVKSIRADFITHLEFNPTGYDEILSWYALPLYSPTFASAWYFYLKAMSLLRPGGRLRVGGVRPEDYAESRNSYLRNSDAPEKIVRARQGALATLANWGAEVKEYKYAEIITKPRSASLFNHQVDGELGRMRLHIADYKLQVK